MMRMAMDIEQLVTWALRDQGLGWGGPGEVLRANRLEEQGVLVDESDHGWHPSAALFTDDDALVVKRAVDGLEAAQRVPVLLHGRSGTRPEGADEALGEPEQQRDTRGRLRWIYDNPAGKRGPRRPLLDMLGWSARRETILFDRTRWMSWRSGLVALIPVVNAGMTGHEATGPEAPAEPWLQPRPVIHGLSVEADEAVRAGVTNAAARARTETLDDRRSRALQPVLARADLWGEGPRGVALATREEAVAEAGLAVLRERLAEEAEAK